MKRSLLLITLLVFSGSSLVFSMDDSTMFRAVLNDKDQKFMVGPKSTGPRINTIQDERHIVDRSSAAPSTNKISDSTSDGWFETAKNWLSAMYSSIRVKATAAGEQLSEAYAEAKQKEASIEGTDQEQLADSYASGKESLNSLKETAQAAKEVVQVGVNSLSEAMQENPGASFAAVAAGSVAVVGLKNLWSWNKKAFGAVSAATLASLGTAAYAYPNQTQTLAQENSDLLGMAAVGAAVTAGCYLVKAVWNRFSSDKGSRQFPCSISI